MDDQAFWKQVGVQLQHRRLEKGLKSTNAVETAGGPSYKTVAKIEAGIVGEIRPLAQYLDVVQLTLVDLFRTVLKIHSEGQTPELAFVIRQFKNAGVTGRSALVSTARLAEFEAREISAATSPMRPDRPSLDAATAELQDEDFLMLLEQAKRLRPKKKAAAKPR